MNLEILEPNIYYYKNVIKDPFQLIEYIEEIDKDLHEDSPLSKWKSWNAHQNEYCFGQQKQFMYNLSNTTSSLYYESMQIHQTIHSAITNSANDYIVKHDSLDVGVLSPLSISKYFEGKFMGPHVDAHDDDPAKTISCVLYLNDNYEGGELNFPNHKIMIKPEAGSLVIFPSKYLHESKVIKSGIKYMAPGFWNKHSV